MLSRLMGYLKRPVAWGAVLVSYAGIIAVIAYASAIGGASQDAVRVETARVDRAIIAAAVVVIRDGCEFDNKRAGELRGILKRSIRSQRALIGEGVIPPSVIRRNIEETQKSINAISLRNCDLAVAEFRSTTSREK